MTDATQAPAASSTLDWATIAADAGKVVAALAPIAESALPGASAAIALGAKIVQGVMDAEPTAVALFNQIKSGTPPTPEQLQQYASDYETAYQKLNADIAAQLAALPPAP